MSCLDDMKSRPVNLVCLRRLSRRGFVLGSKTGGPTREDRVSGGPRGTYHEGARAEV
jgi:hypothetical protein